MIYGLMGRKVGMTQIFTEKGEIVPVTVLEVGPCYVTHIRTKERDGYEAVQLGYDEVPERKLNKPALGHLRNVRPLRHLHEFHVDSLDGIELGQQVDVSIFKTGDKIDVIGTSKGKGFAGVVKRHHFKGGPKTHGQSDRHRAPGSSGSTTTPGRVLKGTRRAGHMGHDRVTILNLRVVQTDPAQNLLVVQGSVPGASEGMILVRPAIKVAKKKA